MKWNKIGRGSLASLLSVALVSVTACSRDYVLAYVYVSTAKPLTTSSPNGGVSAFAVDYQIGSLTPLADSPIPAGRNPVTLVGSPNGLNLYVVNQDDSTIGEYSIGTDGKIYLEHTVNVTGSTPTAVAIDSLGKFLYVTFTYQLGANGEQLYSPASPGPGGVTIFPIASDGTLGTPSTVNVGNNPVGVVVSRPLCGPTGPQNSGNPTCALTSSSGNGNQLTYVYVVDQETSPNATVLGFSQNMTNGALTPAPGTTISTDSTGKTVATGYGAGTKPSAITEDPSARFVYITDEATNQLYGYVVGTSGILVPMVNGPFATGVFPVGVTIDPRGKFLYVANYTSGSVSSYAINLATGTPTGATSSGGGSSTATDTAPTCVAIEPARGIYAYTSNYLGNTASAMQLDPHNGTLGQVQNTPFPTSPQPTCATAVANGSHPTQLINP